MLADKRSIHSAPYNYSILHTGDGQAAFWIAGIWLTIGTAPIVGKCLQNMSDHAATWKTRQSARAIDCLLMSLANREMYLGNTDLGGFAPICIGGDPCESVFQNEFIKYMDIMIE
jgi:hypothetical protein